MKTAVVPVLEGRGHRVDNALNGKCSLHSRMYHVSGKYPLSSIRAHRSNLKGSFHTMYAINILGIIK